MQMDGLNVEFHTKKAFYQLCNLPYICVFMQFLLPHIFDSALLRESLWLRFVTYCALYPLFHQFWISQRSEGVCLGHLDLEIMCILLFYHLLYFISLNVS